MNGYFEGIIYLLIYSFDVYSILWCGYMRYYFYKYTCGAAISCQATEFESQHLTKYIEVIKKSEDDDGDGGDGWTGMGDMCNDEM